MKRKLNTDYLKRVGAGVLIGAVSILLIGYVSYHLWRSFTTDVVTVPAKKSTVSISFETTGYIMRDETVLSARRSGDVIATASDGEKVGINDTVAQIYASGSEATADRIKEIDREIQLLTESLSDGTLSLYDSSSLDASIISLMQSLKTAGSKGSYIAAASLRAELKEKLIKRSLMAGTQADVQNMITDLNAERTALKRSLGACLETVTAPTSGYYFPTADGYEAMFSAKAATELTCEGFSSMIASAPDMSSVNSSAGKLATSYIWYVACMTTPDRTGKISEGDVRSVTFPHNSDITLEMTAERTVTDKQTGDVLVVFSSDRMPPGFDFTRAQPIEILKEEYTCFKVPLSAMRVLDGCRGVYVLDGSVVYFRAVEVIAKSEDTYLVEISPEKELGKYRWLALNDNIIIEGTGLYHERIIS